MGDDGRLLDIVEVNIARGDAVDGDGDGGDAAHEEQLLVARADDARVEERLDGLVRVRVRVRVRARARAMVRVRVRVGVRVRVRVRGRVRVRRAS